MKNVHNMIQVLEETTLEDDYVYILQCQSPMENILKDNDPFTHSLAGRDF